MGSLANKPLPAVELGLISVFGDRWEAAGVKVAFMVVMLVAGENNDFIIALSAKIYNRLASFGLMKGIFRNGGRS